MTEKIRLLLNGEKLRFGGFWTGYFGVEQYSGEKVYVTWKNLFRIQNSYSITIELFDRVKDVDSIYIVDKETEVMYKFKPETYKNGRKVWANGQMQFAPDLSENCGYWESTKGIIKHP